MVAAARLRRAQDRIFNAHNRTGFLLRQRLSLDPMGQDRTYFVRYWFLCIAEFFSAFLSTLLAYSLAKRFGFTPAVAALATIAFILFVPTMFGHFYDFFELAFLLLAAWVALRASWLWLLPVVALATWNKESFLLFLPALYPFLRTRFSRMQTWLALGFSSAIAVAVNCALRLQFRSNGGGAVEFHLWDQLTGLKKLFDPRSFHLGHLYGAWAPDPFNLLLILVLVWAVWRAWPRLPAYLKTHTRIAAVISIPLYILFCQYGELRDLSFLYIFFLALLADRFADWVRLQSGQPAS